ncbi:MAG: exodeoxyribonuclease III [Sorangiineae bacterium]|nr:exodeoxyribonuclease III [Polyangiaceae bacterium]MEB2321061.1 exodeoxyribonuclease III [Sorangiineae bacterium]
MKIATWNVNSIRAREELVLDWLRRTKMDVLCMQETKVIDDDFPTEGFQRLGYEIAISGQKSYNGVAIASRLPLRELTVGLDGEGPGADKRAIAATVDGVRVMSVYVPNGKAVDSPAFPEKLAWFERLRGTLEKRSGPRAELAVCGDFNVAREARDVYAPEKLAGKLHFHPDEHRAFDELLSVGLVDGFRLHHDAAGLYSWWDYRGASVQRNQGMRIDYVLLTASLAARCRAASIDADERLKERPSDHVPVVVELSERAE